MRIIINFRIQFTRMNFHKENSYLKKRYAVRWNSVKSADPNKLDDSSESLKELLEQRESRILKSIGNLDRDKLKKSSSTSVKANERSVDDYGAILMKINDKCLSGDEDAVDHFPI